MGTISQVRETKMSAFSPGFPGISGFSNQKFMSGWASGSIFEVRSGSQNVGFPPPRVSGLGTHHYACHHLCASVSAPSPNQQLLWKNLKTERSICCFPNKVYENQVKFFMKIKLKIHKIYFFIFILFEKDDTFSGVFLNLDTIAR